MLPVGLRHSDVSNEHPEMIQKILSHLNEKAIKKTVVISGGDMYF